MRYSFLPLYFLLLLIVFFFFAMPIHEIGHTVACWIFGLSIRSWSIFGVDFVFSDNLLVNVFVLLGGGICQSISSVLFFYVVKARERRAMVSQTTSHQTIYYILKLASLTALSFGIVNGIWEGFFYNSYIQYLNAFIWIVIFFVCLLFSIKILSHI
jgi:hypothetical protein